MPTYTYECTDCQLKFDNSFTWDEIKLDDSKLTKMPCPYCGGQNVCRDFSGIRINADQGKFDPNSVNYWKRGKTTEQIANVLNDPKLTP